MSAIVGKKMRIIVPRFRIHIFWEARTTSFNIESKMSYADGLFQRAFCFRKGCHESTTISIKCKVSYTQETVKSTFLDMVGLVVKIKDSLSPLTKTPDQEILPTEADQTRRHLSSSENEKKTTKAHTQQKRCSFHSFGMPKKTRSLLERVVSQAIRHSPTHTQ